MLIRKTTAFLLCILLLCQGVTAFAETENIHGELIFPVGTIAYDVAIPEVPTTLYQYTLTPCMPDKAAVESALSSYAKVPTADESWILESGDDVAMIRYMEVSGRYANHTTLAFGAKRPVTPELQGYADVATQLLDTIGIVGYETPFYAVYPQIQLGQTKWAEINTEEDFINRMHDYVSEEDLREKCLTSPEIIAVSTRMMLDGIPLCPVNTTTAGAGCTLLLNKDKEVLFLLIQNAMEIVDKKEDSRELLPWDEALLRSHPLDAYPTRNPTLFLSQVELTYAVGEDGMTHPVWHYTFEKDFRTPDNDSTGLLMVGPWCVDAYTGEPL